MALQDRVAGKRIRSNKQTRTGRNSHRNTPVSFSIKGRERKWKRDAEEA